MKKVLIVNTRELCYFSGSFFLGKMAEEMERLGAEVTFLELTGDASDYNRIEQYMEQGFDGILDINSKLPYFVLDDGEPFLNRMGAPFFNYILDHPLYHHPGLVFPLNDYHAIAIDRTHQDYMRIWYPHLKSVEYLTVAGTRAVNNREWKDRQMELLFTGTYEPEEKFAETLMAWGEDFYNLATDVRDAMMGFGGVSLEGAAEDILSRKWNRRADVMAGDSRELFQMFGCRDFPEFMNHLFPVDKMVRNAMRRRILEETAATGISMTVMGEGWEETRLASYPNVRLCSPCIFARSVETMATAKCVLDVNPLFPMGIHDRVTTAMANGCLCLTNANADADGVLSDGVNCLRYDMDTVGETVERLTRMPEEQRRTIAQAGYAAYREHYTWETHAARLLSFL